MRVMKQGTVYKASRITGPQHNFLGLTLLSSPSSAMPTVETLHLGDASDAVPALAEEEVIRQVLGGIAIANQACGTEFGVSVIQYVPTDTADNGVYVLLAKAIVEAAASRRFA